MDEKRRKVACRQNNDYGSRKEINYGKLLSVVVYKTPRTEP